MMDESILHKICDTHAHPTDNDTTCLSAQADKLKFICTMSTHIEDQDKVAKLYESNPNTIIPFYG